MIERPEVVERIASHGGIDSVTVTPFKDAAGEVLGYQNVYRCVDGAKFGLSPEEERQLVVHGEYLRAVKERGG